MKKSGCGLSKDRVRLITKGLLMTKLAILLFFATCMQTRANVKQGDKEVLKVGGKVTNEKGEPLKGVSVVEKGTNNGTVTKEDGSYALEVTNANAALVFSYVGYANQEYSVKGRAIVDVKLEGSDKSLQDIVVVGYGVQKRVTVTGAVSTVKGSELEKSPTVNLSNALVGRLPGVYAVQASGEPGNDGSTIRIRGTNTLGNTSALVVVDGIPDIAGGLERLNPIDMWPVVATIISLRAMPFCRIGCIWGMGKDISARVRGPCPICADAARVVCG